MKRKFFALLLLFVLLTACAAPQTAAPAQSGGSVEGDGSAQSAASAPEPGDPSGDRSSAARVASGADLAPPVELDTQGLTPVYAKDLRDGSYEISVDCSSSMFRIVSCALNVADGQMTAVMTMSGSSYLYVYPGSAEAAAEAEESARIHYVETADGAHAFTLPVEALDAPVPCAAFSKKKELWYDRTLIFRADSLPPEAFADGALTTAERLGLEDGTYTVEVSLSGGSGKASVQSPAVLLVEDGQCRASIVWSSSNYDYMKVDGVQYDPLSLDGGSAFLIPVAAFDRRLAVIADTTAMIQPHEIEYALYFDSSTIRAVEP